MPYYSELAEAGRGRDLLVFGLDHVGHGESEGERVMARDKKFNKELSTTSTSNADRI